MTGIHGLKFMQRGRERREVEAKKLLDELNGDGGEDVESTGVETGRRNFAIKLTGKYNCHSMENLNVTIHLTLTLTRSVCHCACNPTPQQVNEPLWWMTKAILTRRTR